MIYGYARVSTTDQTLEVQQTQLQAAGCTRIFAEKQSGAKRARSELDALLSVLKSDDLVIVTRLDRLARSTIDLLSIVEEVAKAGAGFKSLAEPWADTTSPAGKMITTVMAGIAEFDRSLILERTAQGRARAMADGVKFGRKSALTAKQKALALELSENKGVREAASVFNVSESTIKRLRREAASG